MTEYQIRNRHRLRRKNIRKLVNELNEIFSTPFDLEYLFIDSATVDHFTVYILDHQVIALEIDGRPFLSLQGILKFRPAKRFVTVDMGAIKFVSNGADIMAPGVVDADDSITEGDLVWVRDEKHLQPLAIGEALMTGLKMVQSSSSKAVRSLHYIGDKLWTVKT